MVHITLALLAVLVSFAFFTLDEETLIILCSFVWVDAASGLLKKFLDFELLHKVDVIRSKFLWFLIVKRTFLLELISFHRSRLLASSAVVGINSFILKGLLTELLALSVNSTISKRSYNSYLWVLNLGAFIYHFKLVTRLETVLSLLPFSSTLLVRTPTIASSGFFSYIALFPRFV